MIRSWRLLGLPEWFTSRARRPARGAQVNQWCTSATRLEVAILAYGVANTSNLAVGGARPSVNSVQPRKPLRAPAPDWRSAAPRTPIRSQSRYERVRSVFQALILQTQWHSARDRRQTRFCGGIWSLQRAAVGVNWTMGDVECILPHRHMPPTQ